jgi:hypothetical protein
MSFRHCINTIGIYENIQSLKLFTEKKRDKTGIVESKYTAIPILYNRFA